jgi:hypothetical protein
MNRSEQKSFMSSKKGSSPFHLMIFAWLLGIRREWVQGNQQFFLHIFIVRDSYSSQKTSKIFQCVGIVVPPHTQKSSTTIQLVNFYRWFESSTIGIIQPIFRLLGKFLSTKEKWEKGPKSKISSFPLRQKLMVFPFY